ncbi:MAG: class I SAM-dependent methyltransferase [Desulfobulbaceae bacterium]|nr:class I SAM-dependent methyltransferase [Desulfobulbaceae bacterium]
MKFIVPVKFKKFYKEYKSKSFTILDVGCGNHAPSSTKNWFPHCRYFGVDKEMYNIAAYDVEIMEKFYKLDLREQALNDIPNNFFNVAIVSHIIEHIPNGIDVIEELTCKLIKGGKIYIEYPSVRSLSFPQSKGSLQFCDDPSHIKLYDLKEVCNVLLANDFRILKAGVRRDWVGILFLPAILFIKLLRKEPLTGFGLWDLMGFAEYVYAEKKE